MIRLRHKVFIYALRVFDLTTMFVTLASIVALTDNHSGSGPGARRIQQMMQGQYGPNDGLGLLLLGFGWVVIFSALVHYEPNRLKTLRSQLRDVIKATTIAAFLLIIVSALFSFSRITSEVVLLVWVSATVLCILMRVAIRWFLMQVRRSGYNYRHLLILGFNPQALQMAQRIDATPELGYKITGYVSEETGPLSSSPHASDGRVIGTVQNLKSILEKGPADEILVCLPFWENVSTIVEAVRLSQELGIVVRLFSDPAHAKILERFHIERFDGDLVVTLFREQSLVQLLLKRLMDFFGSLALLILLSPLLLAVAIGIKLTSPGPVLFVQERVGMNKRKFKLLKFRSMFIDAEKRRQELAHLNEMDGPVFKIKNDPRVTPLGRFIRKTSIDELPQLLNVLRGHMSLVGPRPPLPAEVDQYEWLYRRRLSIKPGVTCLWQISGRNEVTFKQWMEMDRDYIDNWTIWLDIVILAKTLPAVLFRKGAS